MILLEQGYTTTFFGSTFFVFLVSIAPALAFVAYVLWDDRRMAKAEREGSHSNH